MARDSGGQYSGRNRRLAALLAPVLLAAALLYQVLANLQITVAHTEPLLLIGGALILAFAAGAMAAWGPPVARAVVFALCVVIWLDAGFDLRGAFTSARGLAARDASRVHDIDAIHAALRRYIDRHGRLPRPAEYGEAAGHQSFWQGWWDVSSEDGDGDGRPFLDFLDDDGLFSGVPLDPTNVSDAESRAPGGSQFVFYVAPPGYIYEGGHCGGDDAFAYLLALTAFEGRAAEPGSGSGCDCFWRDRPRFFDEYFAYSVCGTFPR